MPAALALATAPVTATQTRLTSLAEAWRRDPRGSAFVRALALFFQRLPNPNTRRSYSFAILEFNDWYRETYGHFRTPDQVERTQALRFVEWLRTRSVGIQEMRLKKAGGLEAAVYDIVRRNRGAHIATIRDQLLVHHYELTIAPVLAHAGKRVLAVEAHDPFGLDKFLACLVEKSVLERSPSIAELRQKEPGRYYKPDDRPDPNVFAYWVAQHTDARGDDRASTMASRLGALSAFWQHLITHGGENFETTEPLLRHNVWLEPAKDYSKLAPSHRAATRAKKTPDRSLFDRILATTYYRYKKDGTTVPSSSLSNLRDRALLEFMVQTGVRAEELGRLKRADVTDQGGTPIVTVLGKGGKKRQLAVPPKAKAALDELTAKLEQLALASANRSGSVEPRMERLLRDDAPLLPAVLRWGCHVNPTNGEPEPGITRQAISMMLRERAVKAGIPKGSDDFKRIHPHGLRHLAAQSAAEAGVSPQVIQAALGHASLATTGMYTEARDPRKVSLVPVAQAQATPSEAPPAPRPVPPPPPPPRPSVWPKGQVIDAVGVPVEEPRKAARRAEESVPERAISSPAHRTDLGSIPDKTADITTPLARRPMPVSSIIPESPPTRAPDKPADITAVIPPPVVRYRETPPLARSQGPEVPKGQGLVAIGELPEPFERVYATKDTWGERKSRTQLMTGKETILEEDSDETAFGGRKALTTTYRGEVSGLVWWAGPGAKLKPEMPVMAPFQATGKPGPYGSVQDGLEELWIRWVTDNEVDDATGEHVPRGPTAAMALLKWVEFAMGLAQNVDETLRDKDGRWVGFDAPRSETLLTATPFAYRAHRDDKVVGWFGTRAGSYTQAIGGVKRDGQPIVTGEPPTYLPPGTTDLSWYSDPDPLLSIVPSEQPEFVDWMQAMMGLPPVDTTPRFKRSLKSLSSELSRVDIAEFMEAVCRYEAANENWNDYVHRRRGSEDDDAAVDSKTQKQKLLDAKDDAAADVNALVDKLKGAMTGYDLQARIRVRASKTVAAQLAKTRRQERSLAKKAKGTIETEEAVAKETASQETEEFLANAAAEETPPEDDVPAQHEHRARKAAWLIAEASALFDPAIASDDALRLIAKCKGQPLEASRRSGAEMGGVPGSYAELLRVDPAKKTIVHSPEYKRLFAKETGSHSECVARRMARHMWELKKAAVRPFNPKENRPDELLRQLNAWAYWKVPCQPAQEAELRKLLGGAPPTDLEALFRRQEDVAEAEEDDDLRTDVTVRELEKEAMNLRPAYLKQYLEGIEPKHLRALFDKLSDKAWARVKDSGFAFSARSGLKLKPNPSSLAARRYLANGRRFMPNPMMVLFWVHSDRHHVRADVVSACIARLDAAGMLAC